MSVVQFRSAVNVLNAPKLSTILNRLVYIVHMVSVQTLYGCLRMLFVQW